MRRVATARCHTTTSQIGRRASSSRSRAVVATRQQHPCGRAAPSPSLSDGRRSVTSTRSRALLATTAPPIRWQPLEPASSKTITRVARGSLRSEQSTERNGTKWTADDGEKRAATTLSGWSCPRRRHDAARREGRDAMIDARRAAPSADGRYRFARAPHLERVEEGHREFEDCVEVRRELVLVVLHLCREQDVSSKGLRA